MLSNSHLGDIVCLVFDHPTRTPADLGGHGVHSAFDWLEHKACETVVMDNGQYTLIVSCNKPTRKFGYG